MLKNTVSRAPVLTWLSPCLHRDTSLFSPFWKAKSFLGTDFSIVLSSSLTCNSFVGNYRDAKTELEVVRIYAISSVFRAGKRSNPSVYRISIWNFSMTFVRKPRQCCCSTGRLLFMTTHYNLHSQPNRGLRWNKLPCTGCNNGWGNCISTEVSPAVDLVAIWHSQVMMPKVGWKNVRFFLIQVQVIISPRDVTCLSFDPGCFFSFFESPCWNRPVKISNSGKTMGKKDFGNVE